MVCDISTNTARHEHVHDEVTRGWSMGDKGVGGQVVESGKECGIEWDIAHTTCTKTSKCIGSTSERIEKATQFFLYIW